MIDDGSSRHMAAAVQIWELEREQLTHDLIRHSAEATSCAKFRPRAGADGKPGRKR